MKHSRFRNLSIFSMLIFLLIPIFHIDISAEEEPEVVRVGYFISDGFQEKDEDGTYSGYSYDYYIEVQNFAKWEYEFVEASYSECLQMLQNGEIDIVNSVVPNDIRRQTMLFTEQSVSSSQSELYAAADNNSLYYGCYEGFDQCKVGILRGSVPTQLLSYAVEHQFTVNLVEYDNGTLLEEALINHEIDMIFSTKVSDDINAKIVERFPKIDFYYAVNPARADIRDTLDNALQKITDDNPEFATNLATKYMISGVNATSGFTKEEMDYLETFPEVQVILNPDWAPISSLDKDTGEFKGICIDVLEQIADFTGITFRYTTEEAFNQQLSDHPDSIYNVIAVLSDDSAWVVKNGVYYTNRITSNTVVTVARRGTTSVSSLDGLKVALPNGFYTTWKIEKELSEDQILYCDSITECLNAVNDGKADVTFMNELVANYQLALMEYSNLVSLADSGYEENLAFVVKKEADAPLLEVLNKAMLAIGNKNIQQIIRENAIVEENFSVKGLYYSNPTAFILGVIAIILIVFGIAGWIIYTANHRKRITEELIRQKEIEKARTEFFMMISHELRTPLNAVIGYLSIAEQLPEQENTSGYIAQSKHAAEQLESIADSMLDYTNIATDNIELSNDFFDLNDVIQNTEQIISLEAEKKKQTFTFTANDMNHCYVISDQQRVSQIMLNILSNAVKFTQEKGNIEASIQESFTDDKTVQIIFTVKDNGIGMDGEFLKRICAPFGQSDFEYSRKFGGVGLGLYLTKYFVNLMHGSFTAQSTLNEGSTFTVVLPLEKAESEQILKHGICFSNIRTLICSSDTEQNEKYKAFLKRLKIKSDCIEQKEQIIRRIQSRGSTAYVYQVCVLDQEMMQNDNELISLMHQAQSKPLQIFLSSDNKSNLMDGISHVIHPSVYQSELFNALIDTFPDSLQKASIAVTLPDCTGKHAMIVEDNAINADILQRVLKKANLTVTVCENGKIAAERFGEDPIDTYQIIFMDIQMPIMNGYEAAGLIRQCTEKRGKEVPILAVSANAFPDDVAKSLDAGMNEHLSKPINLQQLSEKLRKYLH